MSSFVTQHNVTKGSSASMDNCRDFSSLVILLITLFKLIKCFSYLSDKCSQKIFHKH